MAGYTLLQEEAYTHIKEQILSGALREELIYSETKIAAMIGISRTPVKDALVRLSQERLVDILPSRGFRLHRMSEADIWDTYQVRTAVEGFCVVHLAHRKDTPEGQTAIAELERSIARMEGLADAPLDQLWQEDLAFHSRLVAFSGNQEFSQLFESCNHRMSVIAKQSFQSPNRRQAAIGEHRAILEAIRTCTGRDDLTAYGALRTHMEASRDIVLREQISR